MEKISGEGSRREVLANMKKGRIGLMGPFFTVIAGSPNCCC